MPPAAIDVVGLTKRFGRHVAVDDLSMTIPHGNHCRVRRPTADRAGRTRRSGFTILAILTVLVLVVIAVVLHLAGGAPTHSR